MSELRATPRLEKVLTVAGLAAVFYFAWPFGFWRGVGLYVLYAFTLAFFHAFFKILRTNIPGDMWVFLFAYATRAFFRPFPRSRVFSVSIDQLIKIDDSLFFNGKPLYSSISADSLLYYLEGAREIKVQEIKGEYHLLLGKSI